VRSTAATPNDGPSAASPGSSNALQAGVVMVKVTDLMKRVFFHFNENEEDKSTRRKKITFMFDNRIIIEILALSGYEGGKKSYNKGISF